MAFEEHSQNIWVPGAGLVPLHIRSAQKAVEEYDADLRLARDEDAGQWVVLLTGVQGHDYPVLGLGYELPNPDEIKRRLYMADTRKRGREIVRGIVQKQDEARHRAAQETHEAAAEFADAVATAQHVLKRSGSPRIFVPKGVK